MDVLIDTNIILDFILVRQPQYSSAKAIFKLIADQEIAGYTQASNITDIYYLTRRQRNDSTARMAVRALLDTFQVIAVDANDCEQALSLPMADFEDALIVACADKMSLDYIITNDNKFLSINLAPTISADDFLKL